MFADTLDERMSGGFIVAALDIKVVEPGFKDHWGQDCGPSLKEVNERLVSRELSQEDRGQSALEISAVVHITLVETQGGPTVFNIRCLS